MSHFKTFVAVAIILKLGTIFAFSLNLNSKHTINDTDFIFGSLMHIDTPYMCCKNYTDTTFIPSLADMRVSSYIR